jgi:predicted PhzF superfamily epimerase YddE/YHI9
MKFGRDDYEGKALAKKVPEEEPVFLLRAQDQCAAAVIRYYAALNELHEGDPAISEAARAQADAFDEWSIKKRADL